LIYHLFIYNRFTGEHTDLTPDIPYALQPDFCWSPDGSQLAYLSDQHGHFSTYIISVTGGDVQLICGGNDPRCPVSDSLDARDKLVALGKDVELILYESEGYVFFNIDNVLHSERMRVKFLAAVLET
jgi:Tol biopolymer transport system component